MLEEIMRLTYEADISRKGKPFGNPQMTNEAAKAFDTEIMGVDVEKATALDMANSRFVAANGEEEYARGFRTGMRLAVEVILKMGCCSL